LTINVPERVVNTNIDFEHAIVGDKRKILPMEQDNKKQRLKWIILAILSILISLFILVILVQYILNIYLLYMYIL